MGIQLDYTAMMSSIIGDKNGITEPELLSLEVPFNNALEDVNERYNSGELPFWDLPFQTEMIAAVENFSEDVKKKFRNFVLLGIGGSALGPTALHSSLNHLQHNLLPEEKRNGCRYFCPDNVDPDLVRSVLDIVKPEETLFNVVTKSGGTAETIAQFLIIVDLLKRRLGDSWREHLVITTDPMKGFMRNYANLEGIKTFDIDPGVGGRFCLFTPVGLLPSAMVGISIRKMCEGAGRMKEICFNPLFRENPAALFAGLLYLSQISKNKPIHVVFAYSNRLYPVADWFRQLWAESLGKRFNLDGTEVFTGPTPVKAVGATDQHSQVQLYVEGPPDKAFILLGTKNFQSEAPIPQLDYDAVETGYLGGSDLGSLINAEREATAFALTRASRPNMSIILDSIDPEHIGALMYMLEAATIFAGSFYNVNPLDQPGVEDGKKATYALMGREGYEIKRQEMESLKYSGKNRLCF